MQMDGSFVQKKDGIENVVREIEMLEITGDHKELPSKDSAGNNKAGHIVIVITNDTSSL